MVRRTESFGDRTAIITGGASGIGRAMGAELFARGAHVVLADRNVERVRQAATEMSARTGPGNGSISGVELDVREADAVQALVDDVVARHARLDFIFNNARIVIGGRTDEMVIDHWNRVIDVNLNGVVNGVAAAYPLMVRQGHWHIVNTASTAGLAPAVLVAALLGQQTCSRRPERRVARRGRSLRGRSDSGVSGLRRHDNPR